MKAMYTVNMRFDKLHDGSVILTLMDGDRPLISRCAGRSTAKDFGMPVKELFLLGETYINEPSCWLRRADEEKERILRTENLMHAREVVHG